MGHRFNLKRKVVGLPPVKEDLFLQKVSELKEKQNVKEVFTGYCSYCKKKFSNLKTYNAHVKSKKHIEREKIAKENGSDDQQSGTSVNITTEKLDPSKSPEPVVETPVQTEQEFIDEKIANAHHYEPNECLICFKIQESFEVYVIIYFNICDIILFFLVILNIWQKNMDYIYLI